MKRGFSGPNVSGHTVFGSMLPAKSSPAIRSSQIMTAFLLPLKNCKGGGALCPNIHTAQPGRPAPAPANFPGAVILAENPFAVAGRTNIPTKATAQSPPARRSFAVIVTNRNTGSGFRRKLTRINRACFTRWAGMPIMSAALNPILSFVLCV